jgi:hypothetical protein
MCEITDQITIGSVLVNLLFALLECSLHLECQLTSLHQLVYEDHHHHLGYPLHSNKLPQVRKC